MKNFAQIVAILAIAACGLAPVAVLAESPLKKKSHLSFGVFITDQETETKLESNLGEDADLDFEKDLGLDASQSVFRFDGFYRFGARHKVTGSVFDLSRNAVVDIEGEISWQDTTFPIAARIGTDLDFTIYKLAYAYEFLQRENGFLGANIGLYTADISLTLENQTSDELETGEVTAPLPVFGMRGAYALSDRWFLYGGAEIFVADFDDIEGFLYDVTLGIDYWFSDSVALGLAWNAVEIDVDATSEALNADLVWSYSGALLSFKVGF